MTGTVAPAGARVTTKYAVACAAAVLAAYLLWGLRSLIVPVFVGGLMAFICRPFVARLEQLGIPRGVAVGLILFAFGGATFVGLSSVRAAMPSETVLLELRVRTLYGLNRHYQALVGLDAPWRKGNVLHQLTHYGLEPLLDRVSGVLALTPDERALFIASQDERAESAPDQAALLLGYERSNAEALEMRARRAEDMAPAIREDGGTVARAAHRSGPEDETPALSAVLSTWTIAPLVFLFLLWDRGSIKRGLFRVVPNRLFEPALAVLDDVDRALGRYVRGLFLECCAHGLTVAFLLAIVGVSPMWAIAIGLFAAVSNVIPYMGFVATLLCGLGYALLAEDVHPLLPLVTADTFALWVVAVVVLAELLKIAIYEPIVLGGTVRLHPLVLVIGLAGGAILFGTAGVLLAIPTLTVAKVLVASSVRHLKAYGLA